MTVKNYWDNQQAWEQELKVKRAERRAQGCSCRLQILNGGTDFTEIVVTRMGNYGCKLHCDHYGISCGGKCGCGETV